MKRLRICLLVLALAITLCACNGEIDDPISSYGGNSSLESIDSIVDSNIIDSIDSTVDSIESTIDSTIDSTIESTIDSTIDSTQDSQPPAEEEPTGIRLKLDQERTTKGYIFGEILGLENGEVTLHYSDKDGNNLQGFTKIGDYNISDGTLKLEGLIIPPNATGINITGDNLSNVAIPQGALLSLDDAFIFGALSDVHFNRYYVEEKDFAYTAFDNALDYFEAIGADFVGISGDITRNGEESSLKAYNDIIKDRIFPVYTITGNHDVYALDGLWQENINIDKENDPCVRDVSDNLIDFVYMPENLEGDVFVFLNQVRWEYNRKGCSILDESQLEWLEGVLEKYKDNTVYLFFHTFLCGPDGQLHTGVGNIKNPGGYTYDLPYTYGEADEATFRELMKEYKNVVYFRGHSHWMFEMEIYGEWLNFSDFNEEYCTMVHVPSVTEPRYIGENDTSRTGKAGEYSQGWVIYDYGDTVIMLPIDFLNQTYYTEYMEIIIN